MIKSMTGYGRGQWEDSTWTCQVELKSVNHRYLDIHNRLPSALSNFDANIKKWIQGRIRRGRVDLVLTVENKNSFTFSLNTHLLKGYLDAMSHLEKEYAIPGTIDPIQLLRIPGMLGQQSFQISDGDVSDLEMGINTSVSSALNDLEVMRTKEGESLYTEISNRLDIIEVEVEKIDGQLIGLLELHRERLKTRMGKILAEIRIDQSRLLQEAAYHADRGDISEEITRLRSHQKQCRGLLLTEGEAGKKIDFIMQEMNREANTILSKTPGLAETRLDISNSAISIKVEIEKIREQVQNVE